MVGIGGSSFGLSGHSPDATFLEMNPGTAREPIDAGRCPICGRPNDCQMCTTATYKGPCWCTKVEIPVELLALVPRDYRSKACICHDCVEEFHRQPAGEPQRERA